MLQSHPQPGTFAQAPAVEPVQVAPVPPAVRFAPTVEVQQVQRLSVQDPRASICSDRDSVIDMDPRASMVAGRSVRKSEMWSDDTIDEAQQQAQLKLLSKIQAKQRR